MNRQPSRINIAQFNTAIITQRCEQRQRLCELSRGMPEVKYCCLFPLTAHVHSF